MKWNKVDNGVQANGKKHDFHVSPDGVLDVFDSSIECADDAHIMSKAFGTLEEAKKYAENTF
jgi:hypothetical protein